MRKVFREGDLISVSGGSGLLTLCNVLTAICSSGAVLPVVSNGSS
jgi:hypothetical protein